MDKESTTQAESNTETIKHIGGEPHHRRRRHTKRKRSKIKKYFEWFMWTAVAVGFIYVVYSLVSSGEVKDKDAIKDKKSSLLKVVIDAPVS